MTYTGLAVFILFGWSVFVLARAGHRNVPMAFGLAGAAAALLVGVAYATFANGRLFAVPQAVTVIAAVMSFVVLFAISQTVANRLRRLEKT